MIAHRITALRRKRGMSQAQLASILHISPSAEGMYEQGRRIPNLNILIAMSEIFHVSLDYLITGSEFTVSSRESSIYIPENCPCKSCYWKNFNTK